MVEVEAFSSVHDMIQAALDKHGGTATLREVREERAREREMGFCFFFVCDGGRRRSEGGGGGGGGGGRFFRAPSALFFSLFRSRNDDGSLRPSDCYDAHSFSFFRDVLTILLSKALS